MTAHRATVYLIDAARREYARRLILQAPEGWTVTIREPTRTTDQNALLWPLLTDLSQQVDWHGRKLSPDDWKDVCTASLRKMDVVPNMEGTGFVALGQRTSQMGKREFSDLIELIYAFGASKGVVWSTPDKWRDG